MAGTTVAYSEITILDLMDTATYIYYAKNESGEEASTSPGDNKTFIGIYSGKTLPNGQPNPGSSEYSNIEEEIEWSRYVGPQGDKGDSITIDDNGTSIEYAISTDGQTPPEPTSDKWEPDIPTLNKGEYLWTKTTVKYSDGKKTVSYSVSYSGLDGNDGSDANTYQIETNQKEILRFVSGDTVTYSPQTLSFSIYKAPRAEKSERLALTDDSYKLEFLTLDGYQEVENTDDVNGKIFELKGIETDGETTYYSLSFSVNNFYKSSQAKESKLDPKDQGTQFFRFWYYDENKKEAAIQIIESRLGVSSDLAQFSVHANGLTAAIQESKLEFGANGLVIKNGGLQIYNHESDEVPSLFFDNTTDKLVVRGQIEADSGFFEGKIEATEGKIGGFEISKKKLTSEKKSSEGETPFLTLDGTKGEIIAEDIKLTGKITVGESYLSNPDKNDNIVLKTSNIELKNDGTLNLGTIRLYGGTGNFDGFISPMIVDSNNRTSYGNWAIYENGHADFKDITADNVTLKNSVLKIGTIQSAGSLMVFKEAWKIDSVALAEASDGLENPLEITLKDYDKEYDILKVGDWIFTKGSASDSGNFFQIVKKVVADTDVTGENTTFTLNNPKDIILKQNDIIMRLGESGVLEYVEFSGEKFVPNRVYYEKDSNGIYFVTSDKEPKSGTTYYYEIVKPKDYIISISGSKDTKEEYASPNSLTISDFCIDDMEINKKSTKHLILGDLGNSKIIELQDKGFGLYSDNVYLNGSLTTKNQDGISAGISTTHKEYVNGNRIVFWAGATGNEITSAPFKVTQDGSIYANKGTFEGSVITNSIIKGSEVYTMRLHGTYGESNNALEVYGASISFFEKVGSNPIFEIGPNEFKKGEDTFIDLKGTPTFHGYLESDKIKIASNTIIWNENENKKNLIEFSDANIRNKVSIYCDEDFWLGNKMHYQKVLADSSVIGYDLYVED